MESENDETGDHPQQMQKDKEKNEKMEQEKDETGDHPQQMQKDEKKNEMIEQEKHENEDPPQPLQKDKEKKKMSKEKLKEVKEKEKEKTAKAASIAKKTRASWDPFFIPDRVENPPSSFSIGRLKKDIEAIFKDPVPLMFIAPEEDNIRRVHAIICGPEDTPYEGGFFYFFIKATSQYPLLPPQVKLVTTGNGQVRFNPNLYKNGMICLSTLGTWPGPPWTAAQSIQSLLISIQSLLNETPYDNEPGFSHDKNPVSSRKYNEYLRHETLRVAVCDMLETGNQSMPGSLYAFVKSSFLSNLDFYEELIEKNLSRDGGDMYDPYCYTKYEKFNYSTIKERFLFLKNKLQRKKATNKKGDGDEELMDYIFE